MQLKESFSQKFESMLEYFEWRAFLIRRYVRRIHEATPNWLIMLWKFVRSPSRCGISLMISVVLCKRAIWSRWPTQIRGNWGQKCIFAEERVTRWKKSKTSSPPAFPSTSDYFTVEKSALEKFIDPLLFVSLSNLGENWRKICDSIF